jgi:hypothetical protein
MALSVIVVISQGVNSPLNTTQNRAIVSPKNHDRSASGKSKTGGVYIIFQPFQKLCFAKREGIIFLF